MRLITGVLFGLGTVWLAYPYLAQTFGDLTAAIEAKFQRSDQRI